MEIKMHSFFKDIFLKGLLLGFIFLFSGKAVAVNAGFGSFHLVTGPGTGVGTVIGTWLEDDGAGEMRVMGATGTSDFAAFTPLNLSTGFTGTSFSKPEIFANDSGDAVVIWQYSDAGDNATIAGAMYSAADDAWNVNGTNPISSVDEYAGYNDKSVKIDNNGNVLVTWTAVILATGESQVRGATGTIGAATTFNAPFTISATGP